MGLVTFTKKVLALFMSKNKCPLCTVDDLLEHPKKFECMTCGHEWEKIIEEAEEKPEQFIVKDAFGNILADGDCVQMIKDKKIKGSSEILKSGTKSKPIRLMEGDHQISTKMNGISIMLKAQFVKKIH